MSGRLPSLRPAANRPTMIMVAIEGIDGSGKGTATRAVCALLEDAGLTVATQSFPNYGKTAAAHAVQAVLNGEVKVDSAYYLASLFALDRAETFLTSTMPQVDVVVFDRYVLSNAAFQMVRLPEDERDAFLTWLFDYEYGRLGIPRPDLNILMRIDPEIAARLVARKAARSYTTATHDAFEADDTYQQRVSDAYSSIATRQINGPWAVVEVADADGMKTPEAIAAECHALIRAAMDARAGG
jgi:dTMP kinase